MSSPCVDITVTCPACGKSFETWHRASLNLQLGDFDDEYIRSVNVKTCPHCRKEVHLACLVVGKDGVFRFGEGEKLGNKGSAVTPRIVGNNRMNGLWLYTIARGNDRNFEINGETIPVTVQSYRQLVENGRLVEDRWWRISQHWQRIAVGDEVFIYTGNEDLGIIGYAKAKSVVEREEGWCLEPEFDLARCQMLLDRPIPASVVRGWKLNLRRNPVDFGKIASDLLPYLPWKTALSLSK